ncbi:MAG: SDR family NAD(P)-dependent oxidoreductase [Pseudomonadota bacterium]
MDLDGRFAVVSGAGSGLGRAVVDALTVRSVRVVALDLNVDAIANLAGVVAVACDVSDGRAVEAAMDQLPAGEPALAVSCAGVAPAERLVGRDGPHGQASFERTLAVNVVGTFNVMRLAAARMVAGPAAAPGMTRGVIVNTASIAASEGQIGQCAYAASKGAVAGLTLPAARELARSGIRVVAIAPGLFGTPMITSMPEDVQRSLGSSVPFPTRAGDPAEFAALVLHIAANDYFNGSTIRLDGALRMGA